MKYTTADIALMISVIKRFGLYSPVSDLVIALEKKLQRDLDERLASFELSST
jgi:hypothetical protein